MNKWWEYAGKQKGLAARCCNECYFSRMSGAQQKSRAKKYCNYTFRNNHDKIVINEEKYRNNVEHNDPVLKRHNYQTLVKGVTPGRFDRCVSLKIGTNSSDCQIPMEIDPTQ